VFLWVRRSVPLHVLRPIPPVQLHLNPPKLDRGPAVLSGEAHRLGQRPRRGGLGEAERSGYGRGPVRLPGVVQTMGLVAVGRRQPPSGREDLLEVGQRGTLGPSAFLREHRRDRRMVGDRLQPQDELLVLRR